MLDKHAADRRMELIGDFALRLPKSAIGDLLGIPEEAHDRIAESTATLSPTLEFLPMGQSIAKTEIQIALENLAQRCPDMQLETLNPEFRPTNLMRCIKSLNVTW